MKNTLTLLAAAVLLSGCTQGTPGGPGTAGTKPSYGQADDTFNLSVPVMSSNLQQGRKAEAVIGIVRAKNFGDDVALQFADIPTGVTVTPLSPVIKSGDADVKIVFTATDAAPVGDFQVKVTGHPPTGGDAQVDFKLTIAPKDSFTLSAPNPPALKQGESHTMSFGISRDKSFQQDVALHFGELPKGVVIDPSFPVIKRADTEVQVKFTAAEDASLGDFAVKVEGHPTEGVDVHDEFTLTVAKK